MAVIVSILLEIARMCFCMGYLQLIWSDYNVITAPPKCIVQTWKLQENLLCRHRPCNKWCWGTSCAKFSCQCITKEQRSAPVCDVGFRHREGYGLIQWKHILTHRIDENEITKNVYSFLLVGPGSDSGNWTMKEETDCTSWLSSSTQVLSQQNIQL